MLTSDRKLGGMAWIRFNASRMSEWDESTMNVGSSINFDGKAFVDQQEEELEREEQHREQKVVS